MPNYIKKRDLRIIKTHKVLTAALTKLLEIRNFNQVTVNDLCDEASISRTTFYTHFADKYDLLKYWLNDVRKMIVNEKEMYDDIEKSVNDFVNKNKNQISNLVENVNNETSGLLCDFMLSLLKTNLNKVDKRQTSPNDIILSNFCRGGILDYLSWQVKNKFPTGLPVMNPYVYDMFLCLHEWNNKQGKLHLKTQKPKAHYNEKI